MRLILQLLFAVCIAGCQAPPLTTPSPFANDGRYPSEIASFKKMREVSYSPKINAYTVGYGTFRADLQVAVTLYLYPAVADERLHAAEQVQSILETYADAKVTSEGTRVVRQGSELFTAKVVTFTFVAPAQGTSQPCWSELLLVFLPDRVFKVRSTAPIGQGEAASLVLPPLLDAIQWSHDS